MSTTRLACHHLILFVFTFLISALLVVSPTVQAAMSTARPRTSAMQQQVSTITITITNSGFSPAITSVRPGSVVTWRNESGRVQRLQSGESYQLFLPSVMRGPASTVQLFAPPQSALTTVSSTSDIAATIAPGGTFTHTFTEPGSYPFYLATAPAVRGIVQTQPLAVNIMAPLESKVFSDTVELIAVVGAPSEAVTVTARLGEQNVMFAQDGRAFCDRYGCDTTWKGTASVAELPYGSYPVEVTATHDEGETTTIQHPVRVDRRPSIEIISPSIGDVIVPNFPFDVRCVDDAPQGCASTQIDFYVPEMRGEGGARVHTITGTTGVSGTFSLPTIGYEDLEISDQWLRMSVTGTDAAGQRVVTEERRVFNASSFGRIRLVERVPGQILDVDPGRILYRSADAAARQLRIRDRLTNQDTIISTTPEAEYFSAHLTPLGAVFLEATQQHRVYRLYEWRSNELILLNQFSFYREPIIKEGYVLWREEDGTYILRDFRLGTTTTITESMRVHDVAENGDIIYSPDQFSGNASAIFRLRNSATTKIAEGNIYPSVFTDGLNVMYWQRFEELSGSKLMLYTSASTESFSDVQQYPNGAYGDRDMIQYFHWTKEFALAGGWIAYTDIGRQQQLHIWLRDSNGKRRAITDPASTNSNLLEELAPNGEVMFVRDGRRYLGSWDTLPVEVSGSFGTSYWENGVWYVRYENSIYEVVP